jgi:hypothetical protein
MNRFAGIILAAIVASALAPTSSVCAQSLTIDNFEQYTSGQAIATSAKSTPWLRFGAVEDNLFATEGAAQNGSFGAQIPVDPAGAPGFAITARNFGKATNLIAYNTATVLSKSLSTTPSTAGLQLYLSNGTTTFVSTTAQAETNSSTNFSFPLDEASFTCTGGSDSFATVLSAATQIGFQITNFSKSGKSNETVAFDDFLVQKVSH